MENATLVQMVGRHKGQQASISKMPQDDLQAELQQLQDEVAQLEARVRNMPVQASGERDDIEAQVRENEASVARLEEQLQTSSQAQASEIADLEMQVSACWPHHLHPSLPTCPRPGPRACVSGG